MLCYVVYIVIYSLYCVDTVHQFIWISQNLPLFYDWVCLLFINVSSLLVAHPLEGAESLQMTLVVLEVETEQELNDNEPQVRPECVVPIEAVLGVIRAEYPNE